MIKKNFRVCFTRTLGLTMKLTGRDALSSVGFWPILSGSHTTDRFQENQKRLVGGQLEPDHL